MKEFNRAKNGNSKMSEITTSSPRHHHTLQTAPVPKPACLKVATPVLATLKRPYTITYPLTLTWSPIPNSTYQITSQIVGKKGRKIVELGNQTTFKIDKKPEFPDYGTIWYKVRAVSKCDGRGGAWSKKFIVCD